VTVASWVVVTGAAVVHTDTKVFSDSDVRVVVNVPGVKVRVATEVEVLTTCLAVVFGGLFPSSCLGGVFLGGLCLGGTSGGALVLVSATLNEVVGPALGGGEGALVGAGGVV
jgi:hypothetical protein